MSSKKVVGKDNTKLKLMDFISLTKKIAEYLKSNDNTRLSFAGYTETLNNYIRFINSDIDSNTALIKDLNLWFNVLSEFQSFVLLIGLDYENEIDKLIGLDVDGASKEFKDVRIRKIHFLELVKQINIQKKILGEAVKQCTASLESINHFI